MDSVGPASVLDLTETLATLVRERLQRRATSDSELCVRVCAVCVSLGYVFGSTLLAFHGQTTVRGPGEGRVGRAQLRAQLGEGDW